ncbi:hypothetical protein Tco_0790460 [Tanacetum coccineum]
MEVAWCKQNVCMMFDLLGCQGAACCTAKVHEGTDEVLEGTAQEYESTAHSLFKVLNAHIRYHLKELRYCAQCLIIENEDFVKRLCDHYIEPTEFEIHEGKHIGFQGKLIV